MPWEQIKKNVAASILYNTQKSTDNTIMYFFLFFWFGVFVYIYTFFLLPSSNHIIYSFLYLFISLFVHVRIFP